MLEILTIKHNSSEWYEMRKKGIGGSDAAAILGLSPFKTNVDVWEEKVGLKEPIDISDKPQVKYGKEAEDPLFKLFKLDNPQYKAKQNKNVVYKRGFMFASLDGELEEISSGLKGFYENKTTEIYQRSELKKWEGRVPDYYYTQLLHYFCVTGWEFSVLKAQIKLIQPNGNFEIFTRHYKSVREELLSDLKYLYLEEKKFWGYVERRERPPLILPSI